MTRNGPPPEAACALYIGEVMHQRLRPFGHRLAYRVFSLLVDLDRLDDLQGQRHTRFAGAWTGHGFHEHGLRSGLDAAEALGGLVPWREQPAQPLAVAAAE